MCVPLGPADNKTSRLKPATYRVDSKVRMGPKHSRRVNRPKTDSPNGHAERGLHTSSRSVASVASTHDDHGVELEVGARE